MMQFSMNYQEEQTEKLLVEFSEYLNQQRIQDLELIEMAMNQIVNKTDLQQQETEYLLTQLITGLRDISPDKK
jgi:hypothetical protein